MAVNFHDGGKGKGDGASSQCVSSASVPTDVRFSSSLGKFLASDICSLHTAPVADAISPSPLSLRASAHSTTYTYSIYVCYWLLLLLPLLFLLLSFPFSVAF